MSEKMIQASKFSSFVKFILLFQVLTDIVVILDVMFLRQVISFIYLTFIPGFAILKVSKLDKGNLAETVSFSVGLSIGFLMFLGLFVNEVFFLIGVIYPISTLSLIVTINVIVLFLCLIAHFQGESIASARRLKLSYTALLFICLPFLSILGVYAINSSENSFILLVVIALAGALVALGTVSDKLLPAKMYPLALLTIAMVLLLPQFLATNYILGFDVHGEYHVFELTASAARWNSTFQSSDFRIAKGSGMLSVTLLPTIYSKILNLSGTWVFKIMYPVVLSFMALALYQLYLTQEKHKFAFLSAFFFFSQSVLINLSSMKMVIALFFNGLLLLVIFKQETWTLQRSFLFMIFGASLVVSHYSTSYLFLAQLIFILCYYQLHRLLTRSERRNGIIPLRVVLLFAILTFSWYIFTSSSAPFDAILNFGSYVSNNIIADFLNPAARSTTVLRGVGLTDAISILHRIGSSLFYIIELFILIGFVKLLFKRKETNFSEGYYLFSIFNFLVLTMAIVIPNFATAFRIERFLVLAFMVLAPVFTLGGKTIFEFVPKRKVQTMALNLLLIILIPVFFFQTGFVYEISGDDSFSVPLSMYRMNHVILYSVIVDEQEVTGAEWLKTHMNVSDNPTSADYISAYHVLTSYGMMTTKNLLILSNITKISDLGTHIYLRRVNIERNTMIYVSGERGYSWNTSEISSILANLSVVYANDACQIYMKQEQN